MFERIERFRPCVVRCAVCQTMCRAAVAWYGAACAVQKRAWSDDVNVLKLWVGRRVGRMWIVVISWRSRGFFSNFVTKTPVVWALNASATTQMLRVYWSSDIHIVDARTIQCWLQLAAWNPLGCDLGFVTFAKGVQVIVEKVKSNQLDISPYPWPINR